MSANIKNITVPDAEKFTNPDITLKGEARAIVPFNKLETLWINTGTLCNLECEHCYIFSSPTNDDLQYFSLSELQTLLAEINTLKLGTHEIAFTGGEPFMNPQMCEMIDYALNKNFKVLVLSNATQPLQRAGVKRDLLKIQQKHGDNLTLRISLDHHSAKYHDKERGLGSFATALKGMEWLTQNGFNLNIASRSIWNESEQTARDKFAALITKHNYNIDANNGAELMLFPEMDIQVEVPEITTACWDILGLDPSSIMCATSRMVVHRKTDKNYKILPCTLIADDTSFEMGDNLQASLTANGGNFKDGAVKLNHHHCAKFCVLGGGSCG